MTEAVRTQLHLKDVVVAPVGDDDADETQRRAAIADLAAQYLTRLFPQRAHGRHRLGADDVRDVAAAALPARRGPGAVRAAGGHLRHERPVLADQRDRGPRGRAAPARAAISWACRRISAGRSPSPASRSSACAIWRNTGRSWTWRCSAWAIRRPRDTWTSPRSTRRTSRPSATPARSAISSRSTSAPTAPSRTSRANTASSRSTSAPAGRASHRLPGGRAGQA